MTGRQVAEMAFKQQKSPRVPVTLIAGGEWYVTQLNQTFAGAKADPDKLADLYVRAYQLVGHDLMWLGAGLLNYPVHALGAPIEDGGISTPALTAPAIAGLDRLGDLSVQKALAHPDMRTIIKACHLVADRIGRECLLLFTQWGPFTTASRLLGTENFLLALAMGEGGVKDLIALAAEVNWALSREIMAHPDIAGINLSEPVASGDMISPATFKEFVAPYLKDLAARTRARGKFLSLHICGNTQRILPDVLDIRPDCFSLEAKVDLRSAKEVLGGKVCVAGNVSPTGAFATGTPEEVRQEARACLAAWGEDPGYVLTVGCDFPRTVPLANAQALMGFKNQR